MSKPKINKHWSTFKGMLELTKYLQSDSSREFTMKISKEISKKYNINMFKAENIFLTRFIIVIQNFTQEIYNDIKPLLQKHAYVYPMRFYPLPYCSVLGRKVHEKIQNFLRKIGFKKFLEPGIVKDPIPNTLILGTGYSAESICLNDKLKQSKITFHKDDLEWQERIAHADYYYGVVAIGTGTFENLCDAWWYGVILKDVYQSTLNTLVEEMLHNCVDQITKTHRYGKYLDEPREHYWMSEYGEFPELVDHWILKKSKKYINILKKDIDDIIKNKKSVFSKKIQSL